MSQETPRHPGVTKTKKGQKWAITQLPGGAGPGPGDAFSSASLLQVPGVSAGLSDPRLE